MALTKEHRSNVYLQQPVEKQVEPFLLKKLTLLGDTRTTLISPNERSLIWELTPTKMRLADHDNPWFHLQADTYGPVILFSCFTTQKYGLFGSKQERHPDMHAAHFIKTALSFFRDKYTITTCVGRWHSDHSVNYQQYQKAKNQHLDPRQAAAKTWSGKLFTSLGYTDIGNEDVIEYSFFRGLKPIRVVDAYFHYHSGNKHYLPGLSIDIDT